VTSRMGTGKPLTFFYSVNSVAYTSVHYCAPINSVHESSFLESGPVLEGLMQAAIYAPGLWNAAVLIAPGF
jgi:hypothetical protein